MANINPNQLRTWQNGEIIQAGEYNQERNLIIEANNDTNQKANLATLNANNALNRANALTLSGLPVSEASTIQRLTVTLTEGQTSIQLPAATPYLPNTNRITLHVNGVRIPVTETDQTTVTLPAPAIQGQQAVVQWFTEVPQILDVQRIEDAITATRVKWLEPVGVEGQLPYPATPGDTVAVTSSEKVYRFQDDMWVHIMDAPKILEEGVPKVVQLTKIHNATENQQLFAMPLNFDTKTDSAFVVLNTTFLAPTQYTLSNTQLALLAPVKEGDQLVITAYKAMPLGSEGSVSGLVIAQNSIPIDRILNIESTFQPIYTDIGDLSDELQILYWMGAV